MNLEELEYVFSVIPDEKVLEYGLSEPFSWRGNYSEVAFKVEENVEAGEVKQRIKMAYENSFGGYKGGSYDYEPSTYVHFETDYGSYTDGEYREEKILQFLPITHIEDDRDLFLAKLLAISVSED